MIRFLSFIFLFPFFVSAQITGTVQDEKGDPLAFATVYVRNTSNGTVANSDGFFKLQVDPGTYEIVFQYLGYRQHIEKVTLGNKPLRLQVKLEPSDLELSEVVITGDDPAVRIMREAIAKRKYYKDRFSDQIYDVYIKGMYRLADAPKKIMGQDVGNMGGILDTNRQGIIYLSESVSKVYSQRNPEHKKEIMISSKVSGSENGFSLNRSTLTEFDIYSEHINIERDILSPLASNAFSYYNFFLLGRSKDESGYEICKIKVVPKRSADPTFSGILYIVDGYWNLAGADLILTGAAIKQPVLDTMRIQQSFVPIQSPDGWALISQVTSFKFGIFGFKVGGAYNSIFSNYDVTPKFDQGFFDRESFKIEQTALKKDTIYWASIRPIPLTKDERVDYVKKDSLQKIWKSELYLDSMDKKSNKFRLINLLGGYTWSNSFKHRSVSYPGVFSWVQFNTVQGLALNIEPEIQLNNDDLSTRFWKAKGHINYGFSEKKLRGGLRIQRRFESIYFKTLTVEGGSKVAQFSDRNPIDLTTNTSYTLFSQENYLKLYDKTYARAEWSQMVTPGILFRGGLEWAQRRRLVNNTDYTWYKKDDKAYSSNDPISNVGAGTPFPDLFMIDLFARIRFGQTYSTYPSFRRYDGTRWPDLTLKYRKAIPGIAGSGANFDWVQAKLQKNDFSWGLVGHSDWNISISAFLQSRNTGFMDLYHPLGNQTFVRNPETYNQGFSTLPYYEFSSKRPVVEAHFEHHMEGWLLDKLPLIRKLNWKEVFGASIYYTDQVVSENRRGQQLPFWEVTAGFENIGWKAIRPLRIEVVNSFFKSTYYNTQLMIGISM